MSANLQPDTSILLRSDREGVCTLTMNRPLQMNLLTSEMLEALHDFKEVVTFKLTGGWVRDETKLSAKK